MTPRPAEPNEYTMIIIDEARRRGIGVDLIDPGTGEMILSDDTGIAVHCIQSLSDRTSAIAFLNCTNKARTRRILLEAGLRIPDGRLWTDAPEDWSFADRHHHMVVKPCVGEGGAGVSVGVDRDGLRDAIELARTHHADVLIEEMVPGTDLRVLVIDGAVVAASIRRPPTVVGDGASPIAELVEAHPVIGLDERTETHLDRRGRALDEVVAAGEEIALRGTANVHTGGSITDVTTQLSPTLERVAIEAAGAVETPLAGVDCIVDAVDGEDYAIIEINEQPGLANHDPQPTARRYLDLLFPHSA